MTPLIDVFSYHGSSADEERPAHPWRSDGWLWATQGHVLVALKDDGSPGEDAPSRFEKARPYLNESIREPVPVAFSALRAFAGDVLPAQIACDVCHGDGYDPFGDVVRCQHCGKDTLRECRECGGDGFGILPTDYANVQGIVINRPLLAFALSCVPPCDVVRIGSAPTITVKSGKYNALMVEGPTWRVFVMCVSKSPENIPRFTMTADAVLG